jgi:predicted nuclease of predicted toxin-antitoxin system
VLDSFDIISIHVRTLSLQSATDQEILEVAERMGCNVLTADSDFGELIALQGLAKPTILFLRSDYPVEVESLAVLVANVCNSYEKEINEGSVIAIEKTRIRIRKLPIGRD